MLKNTNTAFRPIKYRTICSQSLPKDHCSKTFVLSTALVANTFQTMSAVYKNGPPSENLLRNLLVNCKDNNNASSKKKNTARAYRHHALL